MAYQLGFDIQALIDEATLEAAGPWQGAPLGYTSDYYTPTELAEAFERDSSGTPEATGDAATAPLAGWCWTGVRPRSSGTWGQARAL